MTFAVSLVASQDVARYKRGVRYVTTVIDHACVMIEAANKDEAMGKATRMAGRYYRQEDGWRDAHAKVSGIVIDLDVDINHCPPPQLGELP